MSCGVSSSSQQYKLALNILGEHFGPLVRVRCQADKSVRLTLGRKRMNATVGSIDRGLID